MTMNTNDDLCLADFLNADQVSQMLLISTRTLHRWHRQRIGPPRIKVGRSVFYRAAAVVEWLRSREYGPNDIAASCNVMAGER